MGTDKTLQDNLDYAKGEAAGVGEVAGNVLTGLAYAIENPMEAGEAISASTLKLVADPATTLGDIKDRREDAIINARLDALQGDHYSAGRTQTASDLELGLEIAGMVPVPAGKVGKLGKMSDSADSLKLQGLGDSSTSPWLSDNRAGVRLHLDEFRDGGSFLVPKSAYDRSFFWPRIDWRSVRAIYYY
ncbi:hypothetical protein [Marinimicrobium sp. LS-A18]|uniref:hypothetical protein n=1 Tax=Marinimicrobium sp. LS-A18 TaxID=1381596 RepID=UPI0004653430|nr:hypothetical protein [Marinimicrobium sp. LS-A18]